MLLLGASGQGQACHRGGEGARPQIAARPREVEVCVVRLVAAGTDGQTGGASREVWEVVAGATTYSDRND